MNLFHQLHKVTDSSDGDSKRKKNSIFCLNLHLMNQSLYVTDEIDL